jgi:hypothetical protein
MPPRPWLRKPITKGGYRFIYHPNHPRANSRGYVREHIVEVEFALTFSLPPGARIHHINFNRTDNRLRNLLVCENQSLHTRLHAIYNRYHQVFSHQLWLSTRDYEPPSLLDLQTAFVFSRVDHPRVWVLNLEQAFRLFYLSNEESPEDYIYWLSATPW